MRAKSSGQDIPDGTGMSRRQFLQAIAGVVGTTPFVIGGLSSLPVSMAQPSSTLWTVLVDDFTPQPAPLCGETVAFYNRLGGDRGIIDPQGPGRRTVEWGRGFVKATIHEGTHTFLGSFSALNHPIQENISLNFSAIFPSHILPHHQGHVTGLRISVLDGKGIFQVELQAPDLSFPWRVSVSLSGGRQILQFALPTLGEVRNLNWLVVGSAGDFVVVDQVELTIELAGLPTPNQAFLWSYAMLLANFDPATGLTRDRATFPAGDFDNVSASGMQAAAAVVAWQLGFISEPSAIEIVERITAGLLSLPRCHGLLPHFVKNGRIASSTEWSSLDTVITAVALITARQALGLPTDQVEPILTGIDWADLLLPDGSISHGYNSDGDNDECSERLVHGWKDFGTESWLANLGCAAATGQIVGMHSTPPTFNGSGFIDELAWLLVPAPVGDGLGIPWWSYRQQAADAQLAYYQNVSPHSCYSQLGLFGLSAAEVPDRSMVPCEQIYQAFGVGGAISPNDGRPLLPFPVVVPHYASMVASLRPAEATAMWRVFQDAGLLTPLNNVESLMADGSCGQVMWNDLKGSWNLALQTLGWGRLLAGDDYALYKGLCANDLLGRGYMLMLGRPADDSCGPELALNPNQLAFQRDNTLVLTARVTPEAIIRTVDIYIALQLPDGTLLFWLGDLHFTPQAHPVVRNWTVAPFEGEIFHYTFAGYEQPGSYAWWGLFTEAATSHIISLIAHALFTFSP